MLSADPSDVLLTRCIALFYAKFAPLKHQCTPALMLWIFPQKTRGWLPLVQETVKSSMRDCERTGLIVAEGHIVMSVSAAAALVMSCCAVAVPHGVEKPANFAIRYLFQMFFVDPCQHGSL